MIRCVALSLVVLFSQASLAQEAGRTDPTAFIDIGGSFAEADIRCIQGLGIVHGTTATTFSPAAPVVPGSVL